MVEVESELPCIKLLIQHILQTLLFSWKTGSSASNRHDTRKNSVLVVAETKEKEPSPPSSPERSSPPRLGPGQIKPRGFKLSSNKPVEIKLGLLMTKGQLEVDVGLVDCLRLFLRSLSVQVVCARHIPSKESPPDTYVKCYLRDGERWLQKKKTRVYRHSCEPQFRQTLKYQACDVLGRSLVSFD